MISTQTPQKLCMEDISLIENYNKAIADTTQIWDCHHRRESVYTKAQLIEIGEYYNRPAAELIFLTHKDHMLIPHAGKIDGWKRAGKSNSGRKHNISEDGHRKLSENGKIQGQRNKGRHLTEQQKQHLRKINLGKKMTAEQIEAMRQRLLGHSTSEQTKIKISLAKRKSVLQLDREGNIIARFSSVGEASKITGVHYSRIGECISGRRQFYKNFTWRAET